MGAKVEAEATEANVLGFMPAEEAHFPDAELAEDLCAYAEIAITHGLRLNRSLVRHTGRMGMSAQVHQGTAALLHENPHGFLEEA